MLCGGEGRKGKGRTRNEKGWREKKGRGVETGPPIG